MLSRTVLILAAVLSFSLGLAGCRGEREPADERPSGGRPAARKPAPSPVTGAAPAEQAPAADELSAPAAATDAIDAEHLATAARLINGGIRYFLACRGEDGGWSMGGGANKPAITAMVLKALVQHPDFDSSSPVVKRGFEVLGGYQQEDGGIYEPREGLANYTTSVAVMAMVASQDPQYKGAIARAVGFLKGQQIIPGSESPDGEPIRKGDPREGGVSYGPHGRPDLSNVGMWTQALHDAGIPADDPYIQRALLFVTRCQNRSESNSLPWVAPGPNDGSGVYAPVIRGNMKMGESKANDGPGARGLRGYGSMTYVMFKSMLYAGLGRDDPRVKAAFGWIRRYWRLDSNPNMPHAKSKQGLFYYYHVFAKALRAWGEPTIKDLKGVEHNWRGELIDALAERVGKDGSWVNAEADRWNEGSPILATAYAVLALEETLKK